MVHAAPGLRAAMAVLGLGGVDLDQRAGQIAVDLSRAAQPRPRQYRVLDLERRLKGTVREPVGDLTGLARVDLTALERVTRGR